VRTAWRELAVFGGGFEARWAAAAWGVDDETAEDRIDALCKISLLDWDAEAEWFRLHDLVCEYAAAGLGEAARAAAERRHGGFFLAELGAADDLYRRGGAAVAEALGRFERLWAEAQAAFGRARARPDDAEAQRHCVALPNRGTYLLGLRQHPRERVAWRTAAVEAARRLDDRRGEGNALGNLGIAYADLGQPQRAIELFEQHLAIARAVGDRRGEGQSLGNLGLAYAALGQPQRAIDCYEQHLAIARAVGDRQGEGNALGNLGIAYKNLGQPQRAIEFYEQHLAIARAVGDRQGEANASWNLGLQWVKQGRLTEAFPLLDFCVAYLRDIGHPDADKSAAYAEDIRRRAGEA
jgi:tetratricopeptide (TPR) repeat protein